MATRDTPNPVSPVAIATPPLHTPGRRCEPVRPVPLPQRILFRGQARITRGSAHLARRAKTGWQPGPRRFRSGLGLATAGIWPDRWATVARPKR
jgi:hypothetical protein